MDKKIEEYWKKRAFYTEIRLVLTGQDTGLPLVDLMEMLGKKQTLHLLDAAIARLMAVREKLSK